MAETCSTWHIKDLCTGFHLYFYQYLCHFLKKSHWVYCLTRGHCSVYKPRQVQADIFHYVLQRLWNIAMFLISCLCGNMVFCKNRFHVNISHTIYHYLCCCGFILADLCLPYVVHHCVYFTHTNELHANGASLKSLVVCVCCDVLCHKKRYFYIVVVMYCNFLQTEFIGFCVFTSA